MISAIVTAVAVAGFAGGCRKVMSKPKYGPEHNPQRVTRGIPRVPANWHAGYRVFHDRTAWVNPVFSKGQWDERSSIYATKDVVYDATHILQEEDRFYSGKKFRDPADGGLLHEQMVVTYSYVAEQQGQPTWTSCVLNGPHDGNRTLAEAQRILREWGIPEEDIPGLKKAP